MIDRDDIRTLMNELAKAIGITFLRGHQPAARPQYPFFRYSIILDQNEKPQSFTKRNEEKTGDSTIIKRITTKQEQATISITFVDKTETDAIAVYIQNAMDWLWSEECEEILEELGFVLRVVSSVTTRNSIVEPFYEFQIGFDIRVDRNRDMESYIESVDTVTAGVTVDGDSKDDLIITRP